MKKNKLLTAKYLLAKGFKLCNGNAFENMNMPYYAKDAILLFFNTPVEPWNESDFLLGFADMRCGIYYIATTGWIHTKKQLKKVYKSVKGIKLKDYF